MIKKIVFVYCCLVPLISVANPELPEGYKFLFQIIERAHQTEFSTHNVYAVKLIKHYRGINLETVFHILLKGEMAKPGQFVAGKKLSMKTIRHEKIMSDEGELYQLYVVADRLYDDLIPEHHRGTSTREIKVFGSIKHFKAYQGKYKLVD